MRVWAKRPPQPFLPLLARCAFIGSLLCPAVFLAVYPDRAADRDDYERAPRCAAGEHDSGSCRLITDATIIAGDCRYSLDPSPDDFCEMQLRIGDTVHYIGVDRSRIEGKAGTKIRVESYRSMTTGIIEGDRFIEQRGSPREAIENLKWTMLVWSGIGVVSGAYLYRLRRVRKRDAIMQKG